jgi:hypothetical protein
MTPPATKLSLAKVVEKRSTFGSCKSRLTQVAASVDVRVMLELQDDPLLQNPTATKVFLP